MSFFYCFERGDISLTAETLDKSELFEKENWKILNKRKLLFIHLHINSILTKKEESINLAKKTKFLILKARQRRDEAARYPEIMKFHGMTESIKEKVLLVKLEVTIATGWAIAYTL